MWSGIFCISYQELHITNYVLDLSAVRFAKKVQNEAGFVSLIDETKKL